VLGLAFTRTGWLYPFFGTFLGWLGVALTGSDTSSNALFGSLQRITAQQLGIDPVLIAQQIARRVMGKMVDAQSITIATAATEQVGNEGMIFRYVFWHSIALGAIVRRHRHALRIRLPASRSARLDVPEVTLLFRAQCIDGVVVAARREGRLAGQVGGNDHADDVTRGVGDGVERAHVEQQRGHQAHHGEGSDEAASECRRR